MICLVTFTGGIINAATDVQINGKSVTKIIDWGDVQNKPIIDTDLSAISPNAVQNKAVTQALQTINAPNVDQLSYGIRFDITDPTLECTRVGNPVLHQLLPVQSAMKGVLLDDDGEITAYLPDNDWTTATRDGSAGQVMVEIPKYYRRVTINGNIVEVRISAVPIEGYFEVPRHYVGAYEAALDRSNLLLCSIVNSSTQYRGGNNSSGWDGTYRSLLGMPATYISSDNLRTYARNRITNSAEWNYDVYWSYRELFWLYSIEYANFNSNAAYNAQLDANGYHQGGLGVTNLSLNEWRVHNNYMPYIPCGTTDQLGNNSGVVDFTITKANNEQQTVSVNRYRGIESVFGHINKMLDGILIIKEENDGNITHKMYTADGPSVFSSSDLTAYIDVGNISSIAGWIQSIVMGNKGEIMPASVGGSSSTYYCAYQSMPPDNDNVNFVSVGTLRGAGFLSTSIHYDRQFYIGSRLCFLPNR
jgi:hypothetical protein